MADRHLQKSASNKALQVLEDVGLSPAQFAWDTGGEEGESFSVLRHRSEPYYFAFFVSKPRRQRIKLSDMQQRPRTSTPSRFVSKSSPGPDGFEASTSALTVEETWNEVAQWAQRVKDELETPDLWAQFEACSLSTPTEPDPFGTNPITEDDRQRIHHVIELVKDKVRKSDIPAEKSEYVIRELDYIAGASDRMTRKDWLMLTLGETISMLRESGLAQATARTVFGALVTLIESGWDWLRHLQLPG